MDEAGSKWQFSRARTDRDTDAASNQQNCQPAPNPQIKILITATGAADHLVLLVSVELSLDGNRSHKIGDKGFK